MDSIERFLVKISIGTDCLRRGEDILELTRSEAGIYLRISRRVVADGKILTDLAVVRNGGTKPKQKWYNEDMTYLTCHENLTNEDLRQRCTNALRQ